MQFRCISARGLLLRVFKAWSGLCDRKWWKSQLRMRDHQIAQLETEVRYHTIIKFLRATQSEILDYLSTMLITLWAHSYRHTSYLKLNLPCMHQ